MTIKKLDGRKIALLAVGASLLLCGPKAADLWHSYQKTQAKLDAKTDEATEKLKDFILDEKEPYHPDRPVSDDTPKADPVRKEIIVFSQDWCEPCNRWERCEKPRFKALGWSVVKSDNPMEPPYPHFVVVDGTTTLEVSGYMTVERLESELGR